MIVLSLFDGMSCGRIALEKAKIHVKKYYASEIDKDSIKISKKNYPDIIQLGDVTKIEGKNIEKIDLIIGGSPCQNLTWTVINNPKHNQGLQGEKSILFYQFVRLLKECNPKYFLFENVGSMRDSDKEIISELLGVQPIRINSNLVSAQDRDRLYWTNIPNVQQPRDKGIILKDILVADVDNKYFYSQEFIFHGEDKKIAVTLGLNGHDILKRVYSSKGKCGTLTACRGGNLQKKVFDKGKCRKLTPLEYERLQTVPDNYTESVAESHRYNMLGDGWTVNVIAHILSHIPKDNIENILEVKSGCDVILPTIL